MARGFLLSYTSCMDILEKIFGSSVKARLMRAFVYNPRTVFDIDTVSRQIKSKPPIVKKEMKLLRDINLVHNRVTTNKKGRKVMGFVLNQNFVHLEALRDFLLKVSPLSGDMLAKKLGGEVKAKLVVVSGIFLNDSDARADMLIVSDRPDEKKFQKVLSDISSEFGREVSFALLSSEDFTYRMSMGDRLVRDIFDFPHKVILNKIGLEE